MRYVILFLLMCAIKITSAQHRADTIPKIDSLKGLADTSLRIVNLAPYFAQHVDSSLNYQFQVNRSPLQYYWYLKNAPFGLKIDKDNGLLSFKADKAYFLSGRLKYDQPYRVLIGVQNMTNPKDKLDTSFTMLFYNTEIIPSRLRPTVNSTITIDEGEAISFVVQCENGSFPIERISFSSNSTLQNISLVEKCDDAFTWTPGFDFIKETDPEKTKLVLLSFTGTTKFGEKDTAVVRVYVRDALNYPLTVQEYGRLVKNLNDYLLQLKYTFLQLDRKLRNTKSVRTSFDLGTACTSLSGTILNSNIDAGAQRAGKILPGIGLSLVPIKEAVVPNKTAEQNQASQLRSAIRRLEYMISDNELVGERDPDIAVKMAKLKDEWKQARVQLLDIPLEITNGMSEEDLNRYFNSRKVSRKYRLKKT